MNAVGYFREVQGSKGPSIAQQNRQFLDYCERQGYDVARTFAEDSKAAGQPAFAQLVEYLKKPEKGFLIVIAPGLTTISVEVTEAAARCLQIERLGARLQLLDQPEGADPLDTVLATWSGSQKDSMREKVRDALRRKAVRGEVLGRPPYGYRVGPKSRLELVDDEALVVRYIYRLYLHEGLGIRLIARRLNEEGLQTRRNRPWSMVSIRDILRNRAYLGTYKRLTVTVPGTHPALVSPDDFRHVQERLEARRTNFSPRKVSAFLLSGLLRCANCGNHMIGVSRRQSWTRRGDGSKQVASYRYYQCGSRTNQGICSYNTHRAEEVEDQVREHLAAIDLLKQGTSGDDASVIAHWQQESKKLEERLHQLDRRLSHSLEEAALPGGSKDALRRQGADLADERLRLEEELHDARWRAENYSSAAERRRTRGAAQVALVSGWHELPFGDKQQLLRELIEFVTIGEPGFQVTFKP